MSKNKKRSIVQPLQRGKIGITLASFWTVPDSNQKADIEAVERALDFTLGWSVFGAIELYPLNMIELLRERLPIFTKRESIMLKESLRRENPSCLKDFMLGLNYYAVYYINTNSNGSLIGPQAGADWLHIYPRGLKDLLIHVKENYMNPPIYITENGGDEVNNSTLPLEEALRDPMRIENYSHHLWEVHESIKEGVNVKGYFAWSLLDNFEWNVGYTSRFGLYFVDYEDGLRRYPKKSTTWLTNFLKKE